MSLAGTLHECPDNCDGRALFPFHTSTSLLPAPTHYMVYPKKSRSVAIACPEWSSVDLPKSAPSSIRALSMAKAILQGETYCIADSISFGLPRVL
jgi:hypothetical protein